MKNAESLPILIDAALAYLAHLSLLDLLLGFALILFGSLQNLLGLLL